MLLSYVESILDLGHRENTPVYSLSWSTSVTHNYMNNLQLLDGTYADFIESIKSKGYLDNTILIVMGDHGLRWGEFSRTLYGHYEDRLPNMWIRVPPWMEKEFPNLRETMLINSR
jgi:phosphoglycerol transferase MdoB-like AlkP superfamily enzyme